MPEPQAPTSLKGYTVLDDLSFGFSDPIYQPLDYGWGDSGASTPPPSAQPSFNSPVTQDSFSILDQISTGIDAAGRSLSQILGTATNVQSAAASANSRTQADQLRAQSQNTTMQVQRAQSTAQTQSAQANANIATAFAQFTASPIFLALAAIVIYLLLKKLA